MNPVTTNGWPTGVAARSARIPSRAATTFGPRARRMASTVSYHALPSTSHGAHSPPDGELLASYEALAAAQPLRWHTRYEQLRQLGRGGQGVVYLAQRQGTDGFALPVALKLFSPESYAGARAYAEDMGRIAHVASR